MWMFINSKKIICLTHVAFIYYNRRKEGCQTFVHKRLFFILALIFDRIG